MPLRSIRVIDPHISDPLISREGEPSRIPGNCSLLHSQHIRQKLPWIER
jgi:hypothetical protein